MLACVVKDTTKCHNMIKSCFISNTTRSSLDMDRLIYKSHQKGNVTVFIYNKNMIMAPVNVTIDTDSIFMSSYTDPEDFTDTDVKVTSQQSQLSQKTNMLFKKVFDDHSIDNYNEEDFEDEDRLAEEHVWGVNDR